jgi:2-haloacid dehalogenase
MSPQGPETRRIDAVIFDLGGVLVDWDPRHLYRSLFARESEMEQFLSEICTPAWHNRLDAGRPMDEAVTELADQHPGQASLIRAYRDRWSEMFEGEIQGTVRLLKRLYRSNIPLYALSNFPAEKFEDFRQQFDFVSCFQGIVLSGTEQLTKPDPRIYACAVNRFDLDAGRTLFIDDRIENVESARTFGLRTHHFRGADRLEDCLRTEGLL